MKTKLFPLAFLIAVVSTTIQAQNCTQVNAMNAEISDNLDLRAVASIFGDSRNLQDFERRLNDPRLQISNLDLNYDNQVDYLRVIESVQKRTHVIILQSVIDYDLYQDIATIEVEKDRYNNVNIQVVGNNFMFGTNYIFEPVYYTTPRIYASFWLSNYRPYCSNWSWNYYPTHYYTWNPFPVYRYRNNINTCLNFNNSYNYVNYRSSSIAVTIYKSNRSNGYEKLHPNHSFSRRNSNYNNRYELDAKRNSRGMGYRNESSKTTSPQRVESSREYSKNRSNSQRVETPQRTESTRDYSQNRTNSQRVETPQRTESTRDYSQNKTNSQRVETPQRTETTRDYSQNRSNSQRVETPQRTESSRDYSQNRNNSQRVETPQRAEPTRDYSQNRNDSARGNSSQRGQSSKFNQDEARNSSSREGNRRI